MQIPERLAYLLERDQSLEGGVKLSISAFEPWIKHSNIPFFPEYTKHDIEHIEAVLRTATALIRDDAWLAITSSDAAVLILAVLLHDCAMHLSEEGFLSLLEGPRRDKHISGMEDKPWHILWEDFFGEASRFDGRKLTRLFGDAQPVRKPPSETSEFTKRDRLLIGEFLRRHHPRLAQEIAEFGVPTKGESPLVIQGLSGEKSYIAKLAGIVARSHGFDIRTLLPCLKRDFDIRQYKGVHTVFLMSLLRVGDYLQVEADRAPAQVLQVRQLASPVSQGEWKAHHAIKDVRHTHQDPEAIFVDAFPDDVQTFLRVQQWLVGIQSELDTSWAVLGEVYGRYEGLNRLGLTLRRVRSSLDDLTAFSKKINYLPVKAAFRAADADLLKLLIAPLYGNRPEVGLRELIQNATDAVKELKQYRTDVPESNELELTKQDADVLITIEKVGEKEALLTISDKGIGMSPEIIVDYFLAAGASFRRSENWRKLFETADGHSKILRAGRFGVGALASFLLGPEIEITTRHVEENEGIQFKASVDSDAIELCKVSRPIGTTIKISIPLDLAEKLKKIPSSSPTSLAHDGLGWDWYCLSEPSLERSVFGEKLPQQCILPRAEDKPTAKWHRIGHAAFGPIFWTYSAAPFLACNGLRIEKGPNSEWQTRFGLDLPNVSVFDPDGILSLNLQRTGLTENCYPFEAALVEDVIRDFIAFAIVFGPPRPPDNWALEDSVFSRRYPGSVHVGGRWSGRPASEDWYVTSDSFGFLDASFLQKPNFRSILVSRLAIRTPEKLPFNPIANQPVIMLQNDYSVTSLDYHFRSMAELGYYGTHWQGQEPSWTNGGVAVLQKMQRTGARILVSDFAHKRAGKRGYGKLTLTVQRNLQPEWQAGEWTLYKIGNCPEPTFDFKGFMSTCGASIGEQSILSEIYLEPLKTYPPSPVGSKWAEIIPSGEIPFDEKLRSEKLKTAYSTLAPYIEVHQKAKKQERGLKSI